MKVLLYQATLVAFMTSWLAAAPVPVEPDLTKLSASVAALPERPISNLPNSLHAASISDSKRSRGSGSPSGQPPSPSRKADSRRNSVSSETSSSGFHPRNPKRQGMDFSAMVQAGSSGPLGAIPKESSTPPATTQSKWSDTSDSGASSKTSGMKEGWKRTKDFMKKKFNRKTDKGKSQQKN